MGCSLYISRKRHQRLTLLCKRVRVVWLSYKHYYRASLSLNVFKSYRCPLWNTQCAVCSLVNPLFFVKSIYLSLSSEIISVEGWVLRGREMELHQSPTTTIMTGAQLTFLCTIWDQIALFQPAVSSHYAFNPVKHFDHVHGNPGFALHQLQQIYNGILYSEISKWVFVI